MTYTAEDVIVALGADRIAARGLDAQDLADLANASAYYSPHFLSLLWNYSDNIDRNTEFHVTISGRRYGAFPKLHAPGYWLSLEAGK